jgi:hypothetical protein
MFEHAEDGVQEFAHGRDQGLHLVFAERVGRTPQLRSAEFGIIKLCGLSALY